MKLGLQIKASLLLLIMLASVMHNFIPHVHHDQAVNHHDHSSAVPQPESVDAKSHEAEEFFLDFLFNDHNHARHSHQDLPAIVVKRIQSSKTIEQVWLMAQTEVKVPNLETPISTKVQDAYLDSDRENPCVLNKPLRGPPSLG